MEVETENYWENFDTQKTAKKTIENIKNKKINLTFWEYYRITRFLSGNLKNLAIALLNLADTAIMENKFKIVGTRTFKLKNNPYLIKQKRVNFADIDGSICFGENWKEILNSEELEKAFQEIFQEFIDIRLGKLPLNTINIELEGVFKAELKVYIEGVSAEIEIIDNDFYLFKEKLYKILNDNSLSISSKIEKIEQLLGDLTLLKPFALVKDKEPILQYKREEDKDVFHNLNYYIEDGSQLSRESFNKIKKELLIKNTPSQKDRQISLEMFLKNIE